MDIVLTCALLVVNAIFAVGAPIIIYLFAKKEPDDALVLGQSGILSLLGWGLSIVMLTLLILKFIKPSSWPDESVYMYVTAAITVIGSLITIRFLLMEVRVEKEGLEIRTVLKKRAFYDYRDIELEGKFSNQLVSVSFRRGHLCTISAKSRGVSTMIRKWHDANQSDKAE